MSGPPPGVSLPPGRQLHLPGRGPTFVREVAGPPGAPAVILLHGVTASADLNWFPVFAPLGRLFRVVALDLRGHGRGLRPRGAFRLEDCADDIAALNKVLGLGPAIVVGYSLGGTVAQLVWRRHRELVAGLVLCSTGRSFRGSPLERIMFYAMPGITTAARLSGPLLPNWTDFIGQSLLGHIDDGALRRWVASEMRRARLATIMSAAHAVGGFSSHQWIGQVDVPTAVVVTTKDRVVAPSRQLRLAQAVPGASTHLVVGDHGACVTRPHRFVPVLVEACRSVTARLAQPVPTPRPELVAPAIEPGASSPSQPNSPSAAPSRRSRASGSAVPAGGEEGWMVDDAPASRGAALPSGRRPGGTSADANGSRPHAEPSEPAEARSHFISPR